jgi:adenosylcobinamide-phosphate synthase
MGPSGVAIAVGYGADAAFGDPRRFHPVAGFGRVAAGLEALTYRPSRLAGAAHAALLVGGSFALGRLVERVGGGRFRRLVLAAALWSALGGRSLVTEARRVGRLVEAGDLPAARRAIPALVGRDPSRLGPDELCRAAVESVAENTVDAVVAPLMWAAAAGAPGVLAHRAANTLDAMVGRRDARYERFGWASARLDDAMNWPAARLTAAATALLAPVAGGSPRETWRIVRRDGAAHPSPNGGRAEAAFAGALGLRLGGRNVYSERVEERPLLGDGAAPAPEDVERAARLSLSMGHAAAACLAGAAVVRTRCSAGRSR